MLTLVLSGRIGGDSLPELKQVLDNEADWKRISFDLEEVEIVDRPAVRFLADCEARGIQLKNCPSYIRLWIGGASGTRNESQS